MPQSKKLAGSLIETVCKKICSDEPLQFQQLIGFLWNLIEFCGYYSPFTIQHLIHITDYICFNK